MTAVDERDIPEVVAAIDSALAKLAAHGSGQQVADHLAGRDITGRRNSVHACPVAVYVLVETGQVVAIDGMHWMSETLNHVGLTGDIVRAFVFAFDEGGYPELDVAS